MQLVEVTFTYEGYNAEGYKVRQTATLPDSMIHMHTMDELRVIADGMVGAGDEISIFACDL